MGRCSAAFLLVGAFLALAGSVRADEKPSLERALWLEKTARDAAGALKAYEAARAQAKDDPALRADAALGAARCLVALGRDVEAVDAWKALLSDGTAPAAAKEEARARLDRRPPPTGGPFEVPATLGGRDSARTSTQAAFGRILRYSTLVAITTLF